MKKNIILIFAFLIITCTFFIISFSSSNLKKMEVDKREVHAVKKNIIYTQKSEKKEEFIKSNMPINNTNKNISTEKNIVLYKRSSDNNNYILKLKSNKSIERVEKTNSIEYYPFVVSLNNNGKLFKFNLSLEDIYKKSLDNELMLELYSAINNKTFQCDSSFLKDFEKDFVYFLNIEILDDQLECYVNEKQKIKPIGDPVNITMDVLSEEFKKKMIELGKIQNLQ